MAIHRTQMVFKLMNGERTVSVPPHMGQSGLATFFYNAVHHFPFPRLLSPSSGPNGTLPRRLCLSIRILYNRLMAFDPDNPPIWLRKLHVSAAQINPTDYPASAVEGILAVCRLSNAQYRWMSALRGAVEKDSDRARTTVPHS